MFNFVKKNMILALGLMLLVQSLAFAGATMPADLVGKTPAEITKRLTEMFQRSRLKDGPSELYTVNDLIEWAKQALRDRKPIMAQAFLDFALRLEPNNQKALFYSTLTIIGNNPILMTELKERKIIDNNYNFTIEAITLPDTISFRHYQQDIIAPLVEAIVSAKRNLSLVNETFSDTITDPSLGSVRLDYAAVLVLNMALSQIEMSLRLTNAYDTDFAQLTKQDLGKVTPQDFSGITNDAQALYNNLVKQGYVRRDGTAENPSDKQYRGINAISISDDPSRLSGTQMIYTFVGDMYQRVNAPGQTICGEHILRNQNFGIIARYTPRFENGYCISSGGLQFSNATAILEAKITIYGKTIEDHLYRIVGPITSIGMVPIGIDPIQSHPHYEDIVRILNNAYNNKITMRGLIDFYPRLLAIKSATPQELANAKTAWVASIESALALSNYLHRRDEVEGVNYAIRAYKSSSGQTVNPREYQNAKLSHGSDESQIVAFFNNVRKNLVEPGKNPNVVIPQGTLLTENPLGTIKVNLSALFNSKDMRNYYKFLNNEMTKYQLVSNNFFDPSLGGIFPGALAADLNFMYVSGSRPYLAPIPYNLSTNVATLSWNKANNMISGENIVGFEVYRSTTPNVNKQSTLVGRVNGNTNQIQDANIDKNVSEYYYRVYATFRFSDNATAESYSVTQKIMINPVNNNHAPIIFDIGPQSVNEGDSLSFDIFAVDQDNDAMDLTVSGASLEALGAAWGSSQTGNVRHGVISIAKARYTQGTPVVMSFVANDHKPHGTTTLNIPVTVTPMIDIVPTAVSLSGQGPVYSGFYGTVRNDGHGTTSAKVVFYISSAIKDGVAIEPSSIAGILVGDNQMLTAVPSFGNVNTVMIGRNVRFNPGKYTLTFAVRGANNNSIIESNITNNTFTTDLYVDNTGKASFTPQGRVLIKENPLTIKIKKDPSLNSASRNATN